MKCAERARATNSAGAEDQRDSSAPAEWTALDLFGVHPLAPAAGFDVMGLLLLIQGGAVVALTDAAATIRRPSGAVLTFRRHPQSSRILLSEVPQ